MKTAALGIVVKDDHVLLVFRKWHPILWAPPGGFVDANEDIKHTVFREVLEETGITCEVEDKLYDFFYDNGYGESHIHVYACKYISGDLKCSFESKQVKWFPIDDLPTPISPEASLFLKAYDAIIKHPY